MLTLLPRTINGGDGAPSLQSSKGTAVAAVAEAGAMQEAKTIDKDLTRTECETSSSVLFERPTEIRTVHNNDKDVEQQGGQHTPFTASEEYDNESVHSHSSRYSDYGRSDASGSTTHNGNQSRTPHAESISIGKHETKAVRRIRLVVLLVLIVSATLLAAGVYLYLVRSEERQFSTQFTEDSDKILNAIGSSIDQTLGLMDSVAVSLVSVAKMTNQTWPFVTMQDFAVKLKKILPLTDAIVLNVLPLVKASQRTEWEAYSTANDDWVNDGMAVQEAWAGYHGPVVYGGKHNSVIHSDFGNLPNDLSRDFLPLWQNFPVIANTSWTYNMDFLGFDFPDSYIRSMERQTAVMAEAFMLPDNDPVRQAETLAWADYYRNYLSPSEDPIQPMSDLIYPIVSDMVDRAKGNHTTDNTDDPLDEAKVVGTIVSTFYWRDLIRGILPDGSRGIQIVFEICDADWTYEIHGSNVVYLGVGDLHDKQYDAMGIHSSKEFSTRNPLYTGAPIDAEYCQYALHLYPSDTMKSSYTTNNRAIFTTVVVLIFAFTSLVFYLYHAFVEHRQERIMQTAVRSTKIVSSLFPSNVRDRLYPTPTPDTNMRRSSVFQMMDRRNSVNVLGVAEAAPKTDSPIAELYPDTTVLFADIAGFTAWSSSRSPTQVFILLETLYAAFDEIANYRRIFKVETIGDCYVAVVGLPTPRKAHAVAMVRFATDCRNKFQEVSMELEKTLGPGTADLALRIGLNSGPTTAGVLRGEKSRFQLFGDTVNTAARMESNGERNRIHVSQKTADLIRKAGKGHWLTPRAEKINAKGKGAMQTYWCEPKAGSTLSSSFSEADVHVPLTSVESEVLAEYGEVAINGRSALQRLVDWNADLLTGLLTSVVQHRNELTTGASPCSIPDDLLNNAMNPRDELDHIIFPVLTSTQAGTSELILQPYDQAVSHLDEQVEQQLHEYISCIADLYNPTNAFHNFEHCSHVAMSTKKLLDRILATSQAGTSSCGASTFVTHPLTMFAVVFAALIHDVDHGGVSNAQLVDESNTLALVYKGKSVAEQHSIVTAFRILSESRFAQLRSAIFTTQAELLHFRYVLIHVVMSTDLFDADLQEIRMRQWDAFLLNHGPLDSDDNAHQPEPDHTCASDFATDPATAASIEAKVLLQLIIQASDVVHTMQHFTVYTKWNTSLFHEMYLAFKAGRAEKDPTLGWFDNELQFLDVYVIPLATKLRMCGGVFGVSCDEFLDYATDNRMEWDMKGRDIVQQAKEAVCSPTDN